MSNNLCWRNSENQDPPTQALLLDLFIADVGEPVAACFECHSFFAFFILKRLYRRIF